MSDDQPKISEPKTIEIGGVRYRVAVSYPEPTGTLEDAARIVAERYGLRSIVSEEEDNGRNTE